LAIELQILGSNSAAFAHNRHHTSQLLRVQDKYFLIDCGEGTQLLIKKNKIKLSRINEILISHLHGDHYYGLMGLISTLHLYGRQADLHIYGPPGLSEIITLQLKYSQTRLSYDIKFHEWIPEKSQVIYEDSKLTITTIPLNHRIPCSGYFFKEKIKKRGINKSKIGEKLTPTQAIQLRNGEDLYNDMKERAESTYHTTAKQAAQLAKDANVKCLLLGHFSTRYKDLNPLLSEARSIFRESYLAEEGKKFVINH
jgi:ribonuclease Z